MRIERTNILNMGFVGKATKTNNINDEELIGMFIGNEPDESVTVEQNINHRVVDYEDATWYIFTKGNENLVFKKLPLVNDDENFHWIYRHTKEGWRLGAEIFYKAFKFVCRYNEVTERCTVEVYINKPDGYTCHIDALYIENATNKKIFDEIEHYRNEMVDWVTTDKRRYMDYENPTIQVVNTKTDTNPEDKIKDLIDKGYVIASQNKKGKMVFKKRSHWVYKNGEEK